MHSLRDILMVEDSLRDAELALEALSQQRLANPVVHVRDGAEALDYLYRRAQFADRTNGHPVAVLLDLKMPKVDGLEVLRQVKGDPDLRTIPVVMMTSSREEQDLVEGYEGGANAYVVKPMDFSSFMDAMKAVGVFWAAVNEPPPTTTG